MRATVRQVATEPELEARYRARSLWLDQLDGPLAPRAVAGRRPRLRRRDRRRRLHRPVDGLLPARRSSRTCASSCIEREIAGFGPSGRNGGWAVGGLAGSAAAYRHRARSRSRARARCARPSTRSTRSARSPQREQIDCGFVKAGALTIATSAPQWRRLQARAAERRPRATARPTAGCSSAAETEALVRVPALHGGWFTPHAARDRSGAARARPRARPASAAA